MLEKLTQLAQMTGKNMNMAANSYGNAPPAGAKAMNTPANTPGPVGTAPQQQPAAKGLNQLIALTKAPPMRPIQPLQNPNMGRTLGKGVGPRTPVMSQALRRTMQRA